jgi:hypothetical protein
MELADLMEESFDNADQGASVGQDQDERSDVFPA